MRSFIFGVEDSLVSTVGLLSGAAVGGLDRGALVLTGAVLVCVEAFSMGVGNFLSEASADDFIAHKETSAAGPAAGAFIMLVSYIIAGAAVLLPYVILPVSSAFWSSIGISLCMLLLLGFASARLSGTSAVRGGIRMMLVGGLALSIGIGIAVILKPSV